MWNKIAIVVAIVLGILAIILARSYLERKIKDVKGKEVNVVAASRDIKSGETITIDMLGFRPVPEKFLFDKCVRVKDHETILGRKIRYDVNKRQLLAWPMFEEEIRKKESIVPLGFRAMTISVSEVTGVGGHLQPGSRVDVVATFFLKEMESLTKKEKVESKAQTITLMQNVEILALGLHRIGGQLSDQQIEEYRTATLALTPLECELLAYTQTIGRTILVLRHPAEPYELEEEGEPRKVGDEVLLELIKSANKIRARHVQVK